MKNSRLWLNSIVGGRNNFTFCSLNLELSVRLVLWLVSSLILTTFFFPEFWASLPTMLSPSHVFRQHHAAPWGVLALCLAFLWLRRKQVWHQMSHHPSLLFTPLGLGLIAGAVLMPSSPDYPVFPVLLAWLGVLVIFFGRGAKVPSILLAIYGFAISFPLAVQRFAEAAYSRTALVPLVGLMTALDYPLQNNGQWIHFTSFTGEPISVIVTAACAGPVTMGVFLAIFALMMLDMPLPPKKAAALFLFGVAGTWLTSFTRLVILLLAGYHLGKPALWSAHAGTIYALFPLWYLLFAYIYFRQFGVGERAAKLPVTATVRGGVDEQHTGTE